MNFNRPKFTRASIEQVRKYRPKRLYLAADGPRRQVSTDLEDVAAVRQILGKIDWDCKVYRKYSDSNLGCKKAVQRNLAWFFEKEEEGIILEDDCIASPSFFKFAGHLLEKFRTDERIAAIHGSSVGFAPEPKKTRYSYHFTQFMNMWGWASWRRTYRLIDNKMAAWQRYDDKKRLLEKIFASYGSKKDPKWVAYWFYQLSKVFNGEIDTWDYQWIFNILEKRMYCVSPKVNMIENIGWGPGATHTREQNPRLSSLRRANISFPLIHPPTSEIQIDHQYEDHIKEIWCDLTRFYGLFIENKQRIHWAGQSAVKSEGAEL